MKAHRALAGMAALVVAGSTFAVGASVLTRPVNITKQLKRQLGAKATAPTSRGLAAAIAALHRRQFARAGDGGPATVRWRSTERAGSGTPSATGVVTVTGIADDSIDGRRVTFTLRRTGGGSYDSVRWTILRADRSLICARGVSAGRTRCV